MPKDIKEKIIEMFQLGVDKPIRVIVALRKMKLWKDERLPTRSQISSFLKNHKKLLYGESAISYSELREHCKQHSKMPTESDQVFVTDYIIDAQQDVK